MRKRKLRVGKKLKVQVRTERGGEKTAFRKAASQGGERGGQRRELLKKNRRAQAEEGESFHLLSEGLKKICERMKKTVNSRGFIKGKENRHLKRSPPVHEGLGCR